MHLVQKGVELAQLLRLNLSFTQHLENKTTWQRRKIYLREMWKNLGPIICGPDPDAQPKKKVIDHMYDYRCRTSGCRTRAMRLMLYLLLHNPKIAYSPNGTAADKVIEKVIRVCCRRYFISFGLWYNGFVVVAVLCYVKRGLWTLYIVFGTMKVYLNLG